jgi:hypothetical protein
MADREIYYRGKAEFSHHCQAGWRSHTSTVIVQQISPRMGVIIQSDGGGQYRRSNRQWYPVARVAEEEVGKKIQLSRVISNADTAADLYEMLDKELKKKHPDPERIDFIYWCIAQHFNFAGFKR